MVAGVLARVGEAARMRQGQASAEWVRMTNPAGWGEERQAVLREAARRAGLGEVELMTEPEAAAWFFVEDRRGEEPVAEPGRCVAVYDLGGGTFDTAILRRSEQGFELAGPPGGLDWFGGEDFDQRLYDWVLGRVYELDVETWRSLKEQETAGWRRARLQLREDVRQAKEALSTMAHVSVPVSKGEEVIDVEVTRAEFESLIQADLRRTVDILEKTARDAGVTGDEIAAVYLTGGSSRVPLAAALASEFHPHTYTRPDPKTLVAQGALAKPEPRRRAAAAAPAAPSAAPAPAAPAERKPEPPRPLCRRKPRVSGRAAVGKRLTLKTGAWSPGTDLTIEWQRQAEEGGDWTTIGGADKPAYELVEDDARTRLSALVTGRKGERAEEARSGVVGPVRPAREKPAPAPVEAPKPAAPKPEPAAPKPVARPKPRAAERGKSARLPAAIAAGLVGAAALGLLLGGAGSAGSEPASFERTARSDAVALDFTEDWRRTKEAAPIPGLRLRDSVALASVEGPAGQIQAGMTDATGPTMLPDTLSGRLAEEPKTDDPVRLGKLDAYRYGDLRLDGKRENLRLYVAPTTGGVATVACSAKPADAQELWESCETVATTLSLRSGEPLSLAPSEDYAQRITRANARLSRTRAQGRKDMRAAKRPAAQERAAESVAGGYRQAARAVRGADPPPQAGDANREIVVAFGSVADAYSALASAASSGGKKRWNAARAQVQRREAAARRAIAGLEQLGYTIG